MIESQMVSTARRIATQAHKGQTRWDKTPYIVHPERVARSIAERFDCSFMIAAALLHDVVEDTEVTLDDLRAEKDLEDMVIVFVDALTHRENETYLDFILRIKRSSDSAIELKKADINDNLRDLRMGSRRDKYELALWVLDH